MKYNDLWYETLKKPDFTPSPAVFPVAWNILYAMMFIALLLIIFHEENIYKKYAYILFGLQLLANFYWVVCFFREHNLYKAFIVAIILSVLVGMTMSVFFLISKFAGVLFLPYFLWCSFAAILSYNIFKLNS